MFDKDFKPGVYEHYKGGLYTALMLVTHHETKHLYVVYVSHTTGETWLRPLDKQGEDSWLFPVWISFGEIDQNGAETGSWVPRFKYLRPTDAAVFENKDLGTPFTVTKCVEQTAALKRRIGDLEKIICGVTHQYNSVGVCIECEKRGRE